MNVEKKKWVEKLDYIRRVIFNEKTWKGMRITYNVIWNVFLLMIIFGLIGAAFAGGVGAGYFASLVKDEPIRSYENMKKDLYNYEETTEVYFANNKYLGKLRSDIEREEVKLKDVSPHVINAVIATEDEYFYEHNGVVPKAIMRAIFQEITNSSVRTGGSTLTQQLIKNQILSNEVSFDRKAKEILLALRLEKFFTKDEILEAYLNVVSFGRNSSGRNIAGVQAAARGIFDVDAKDLNLPQAAFIAGLPQNPYVYTPFTNKGEVKKSIEPGIKRMKIVLRRMLDAGFITEKEYQEALQYDIRAHLAPPKPSSVEQYPWLTYEVEKRARKILASKLAKDDGYEEKDLQENKELYDYYMNLADKNLRQNGYKIHTTIDKDIYDKMQEVVKTFEYYGSDKPERKKDPETGEMVDVMEPVEVGAMLIENETGRVISFVGGRDYKREQLNHATDALRPNGSTMKPLLVYAPAMEMGVVQPGTVIADMPFRIGGYTPKNYGGGYHGLTSVRNALQWSYNIPAVKTYAKTIHQRPAIYLEKMGFSSLVNDGEKNDYENLAMALGGMTKGVTVEENVNAYATFANGGKFVDAYLIEKIETKDGQVIYEHQSKPVDVFSPQTAYLTIDMMRDVVRKGTASSLNGYLKFSADWAGKTGTGQDYKDAWFVASNPNVTFGTWIGYDTPKPLQETYKGLSYSRRNILLWAKLMNVAYDVRPELVDPKESFKMPGGIVRRSYCALSGLLPSNLCLEAGLVKEDLFNIKFVPKKVDDYLTKGKYILVKDKAYRVPASAPLEFVREGIMLKKEFLEEHQLSNLTDVKKLLPNFDRIGNLVITENREIQDNGSVPSKVTGLKISGRTLSWASHPHHDIIGYRVYAAPNHSKHFTKIASVMATKNLQINIGSGAAAYYVTAVDVTGKESAPSDIVKYGNWQEEKPKEETPPPPPKAEQPAQPPSSPPPGNNNGNGGNQPEQPGNENTNEGNE
jgi:penicillin-binding protein 1B